MASKYLQIEATSGNFKDLVKENMKFKTGNFIWRVKFSTPLNPATVNNMNLYVTDLNESPLKTAIHYDAVNHYVEIEPLEAYAENESYLLNISKNVESKGGQKLKNDMQLRFRI